MEIYLYQDLEIEDRRYRYAIKVMTLGEEILAKTIADLGSIEEALDYLGKNYLENRKPLDQKRHNEVWLQNVVIREYCLIMPIKTETTFGKYKLFYEEDLLYGIQEKITFNNGHSIFRTKPLNHSNTGGDWENPSTNDSDDYFYSNEEMKKMQNRKHYKDYEKVLIASSDIAQFTVTAIPRNPYEKTGKAIITTGRDGDYYAYIVDKEAVIGDHYKKILEAEKITIYSDGEGIKIFCGDDGGKVEFYRAGNLGFLIKK